jgi:DNA-binding IclR family transcriptional regulator
MANGDLKSSAAVRSLTLLRVASSAGNSVSEPELAHELGLPTQTVKRLIHVLEYTGHLQRVPGRKQYIAGNRLNELAIQTLINAPQRNARRLTLQDLVDEIGQTCNVSCLAGDAIVLIDRVDARPPLREKFKPGATAPLHCTASGKLFLSMMPPQWRKGLLTSAPLKPFTDRTLTDSRDVEKNLTRIRAHQIGLDNAEFRPGLIGVAVPVFDAGGKICATVSTNADTDRSSIDDILRLVPALKRASRIIAQTF